MGRFSLKKKSDDTDEDAARSSLFGSRSSKKTASDSSSAAGAAPSNNPYAQPQRAPDPYVQDTNKYAGMGKELMGPPKSSGHQGGPPPPPYGAGSYGYGGGGGGYQDGRGAAGYDNGNRYGQGVPASSSASSSSTPASRYGPAGYGGLGRTASHDSSATDANRNALFGNAADRYQQRGPGPAHGAGVAPTDGGNSNSGGYGGSGSGGYGAYGGGGADRQLTAEEEEEEDVAAAKQELRLLKQEDVAATRNALRIAAQAEETGRATLERLAAQGERIHNTEKSLDLASNQLRVAEDRAKELKTLNKSMFAVHVSNPFTSGERRRQRDEDVLDRHRREREQREATRSAAFASKARVDGAFKELNTGGAAAASAAQKSRLAERAKYQFEADSEDDAMEDEIDRNLDTLGQAAGRLNAVARATGREVDAQNKQIDAILTKSDRADDQLAMGRARLDRFH